MGISLEVIYRIPLNTRETGVFRYFYTLKMQN